jgi:hypothetical protein
MGKQICQNNSPIGLSACEQLIRIALHIPYLKDEKPIGIMLIAQPGMGKSMVLTRFKSDNIARNRWQVLTGDISDDRVNPTDWWSVM